MQPAPYLVLGLVISPQDNPQDTPCPFQVKLREMSQQDFFIGSNVPHLTYNEKRPDMKVTECLATPPFMGSYTW
ncbi:hypothetical protein BGAL_0504g00090 [Botrytis galanthina]|uniref:Uncharacterized protein n=1 Tax=Botrytis galanthina TaxID=278940 RepID=A0A4S8QX03_9HELO|nr:hypothetical protein BGAL_0504g00090 [Botrytis galanthina]